MKFRAFFRPSWIFVLLFALIPAIGRAGEALGGVEVQEEGRLTHVMMRLVIQLGVILFAARLGNMVFERMKLPGVLGELCAGILIGPFLLGGIGLPFLNGFEHGLFGGAGGGAVPVSIELYGFCTVASVVLLFLVGVETDLKMFARYSVAGSLVGVGGVVCSFFGGHQLGYWLIRTAAERADPNFLGFFDPGCIFLGIMSTATSVSITARILSEKKKLDTPEGVTILAGAVIDDVLGVIMLAIGIGVINSMMSGGAEGAQAGVNWMAIGRIALRSILVWLGATVAGVLLSRWIGAGLKKFAGGYSQIAIMALGLALIVAGLFEEAQLAMIIGAYVMGLSLSRTDISRVVQESLEPIFTFLVPIFFVVMGMMVNVRELMDWNILIVGLAYTSVAVLAKLMGCGLPALLCGFNARGALRVGLGMVPRGEVALIIAGVGLASGYLQGSDFGIAVFMTLVTTLIPPPLLVAAFASNKPGHKNRQEDPVPEITYTFPEPEVANLVLRLFLSAMRREGFFIHRLEHGERIYQLRKDAMVIGVRCPDASLIFECDANEIPFVRTAMREVVVEMDQTLGALRQPFSSRDITNNLPAAAPSKGPPTERMLRFIRRDTLVPDLKGRTKQEVIGELVNAIAATGLITDPLQALDAVIKRELGMSTALGNGLAVPHARTDQIRQLVCAIGISRAGVDFESGDNAPVHIITLVLSPLDSVTPYMEFMSTLQGAFDEAGRDALLHAQTSDDMFAVFAARRRTPAFFKRG